jgi:hypothetical protein
MPFARDRAASESSKPDRGSMNLPYRLGMVGQR